MSDLKRPRRTPSRHDRQKDKKEGSQFLRKSPFFGSNKSAPPLIPKRKFRKRKKGFVKRWLFRLVILVCLISALPMLVLRYYDPPTSRFIELNKSNNNKNIKHQWVNINFINRIIPRFIKCRNL